MLINYLGSFIFINPILITFFGNFSITKYAHPIHSFLGVIKQWAQIFYSSTIDHGKSCFSLSLSRSAFAIFNHNDFRDNQTLTSNHTVH